MEKLAGFLVYSEHLKPNNEPIPNISNLSLAGVGTTPDNASYMLNFSSPFSINPHWIKLSAFSGSYASLLTYSGHLSSGFEYTDISGFHNAVSITNWNGSSSGIFSNVTIKIDSWSVPGHSFTKYGSSLEITYNNNTILSKENTQSRTFRKRI